MDEKSHVTPIINKQVRSVTLTIILWIFQGIQDSVPLLLIDPTLPVKHISRFIVLNDSHNVVLGREIFARLPREVTAEGLESLNRHCHMGGYVDIFSDTDATRHINYLLY